MGNLEDVKGMLESEIKWCRSNGAEDRVGANDDPSSGKSYPTPEFKSGFLAGLQQAKWFV